MPRRFKDLRVGTAAVSKVMCPCPLNCFPTLLWAAATSSCANRLAGCGTLPMPPLHGMRALAHCPLRADAVFFFSDGGAGGDSAT